MARESKLLVATGATGLIGRHLVGAALAAGHRVRILSRGARRPDDLDPAVELEAWDPGPASRGEPAAVDAIRDALEGADWIVNLAGESIGEGRLTEVRKARILSSRVEAAGALQRAFVACKRPPSFWFQASAVGFYGDTGEQEVSEDFPPGSNFLSDVCVAWEGATNPVAQPRQPGQLRARLAIGRIGVVFARDALAWQKLVKPIRLGAGGPLGSGKQWWSWIDADDLARAILFLAEHAEASGAFNFTSPEPVRQIELARAIARRIRRPSFIPAPAFALRLILGELAELALLSSCKAMPRKLEALGFTFERGTLERALDHLLG